MDNNHIDELTNLFRDHELSERVKRGPDIGHRFIAWSVVNVVRQLGGPSIRTLDNGRLPLFVPVPLEPGSKRCGILSTMPVSFPVCRLVDDVTGIMRRGAHRARIRKETAPAIVATHIAYIHVAIAYQLPTSYSCWLDDISECWKRLLEAIPAQ